MNGLRVSGYGHPMRQDILVGIIARDAELRRLERYRTGAEIRSQKVNCERRHLNTWFLRGTTTSVLKVQPTPGGILAKRVREKLKHSRAPDGGTTLVVEGAGNSILAGLRKPDPYISPGCQFGDGEGNGQCLIHEKQTCWASRLVYALYCTQCPATYVGTTGLTAHRRCQDHLQALRREDDSYAISKHYILDHPGMKDSLNPFVFKILGAQGIRGNLQRYLMEALKIREAKEGGEALLNSRGEWARVALKRLVIQDS